MQEDSVSQPGTRSVDVGERIDLMGIPIDRLTMEQTLRRVEEIIAAGQPVQHMAINAGKVVTSAGDPELLRVIRGCGLINADGAGVVYAARFLGQPLPERVAGVDMFTSLIGRAAEKGWRPYLLGAKQEVVAEVVRRFEAEYPGLEFAGWRNGYFVDEDEPGIAAAIRESGADMLFVAITSPKKEKFLGRWMPEMGVPFCMGVGGSFDVVAGVAQRAPLPVQEVGLEWAWRFAQEPRRMWKRYLVGNTRFVAKVLRARLTGYRLG
jgi:N-acetylglucosaminyldiphosphoundecaprenol N-acetyl-beta-D-mannosaminyltransferase